MSTRLRFLPDSTVLENSFLAGILRRETVGGAIALIAAACAVVWANSPIADAYTDLRQLTLGPLDSSTGLPRVPCRCSSSSRGWN